MLFTHLILIKQNFSRKLPPSTTRKTALSNSKHFWTKSFCPYTMQNTTVPGLQPTISSISVSSEPQHYSSLDHLPFKVLPLLPITYITFKGRIMYAKKVLGFPCKLTNAEHLVCQPLFQDMLCSCYFCLEKQNNECLSECGVFLH